MIFFYCHASQQYLFHYNFADPVVAAIVNKCSKNDILEAKHATRLSFSVRLAVAIAKRQVFSEWNFSLFERVVAINAESVKRLYSYFCCIMVRIV